MTLSATSRAGSRRGRRELDGAYWRRHARERGLRPRRQRRSPNAGGPGGGDRRTRCAHGDLAWPGRKRPVRPERPARPAGAAAGKRRRVRSREGVAEATRPCLPLRFEGPSRRGAAAISVPGIPFQTRALLIREPERRRQAAGTRPGGRHESPARDLSKRSIPAGTAWRTGRLVFVSGCTRRRSPSDGDPASWPRAADPWSSKIC